MGAKAKHIVPELSMGYNKEVTGGENWRFSPKLNVMVGMETFDPTLNLKHVSKSPSPTSGDADGSDAVASLKASLTMLYRVESRRVITVPESITNVLLPEIVLIELESTRMEEIDTV